MADKVDDILINIEAETSGADEGLEKLASALRTIKNAVNGIKTEKFASIKEAINGLKVSGEIATNIETVAASLSRLANSVKDVSFSKIISETKSLYTVSETGKNVDELSESITKLNNTTNKQSSVNSGAFRQIVDAVNGISVTSETGTALEQIGKGYRSIAQSVKNLQTVKPEELKEIVSTVSQVGSSLGNLGSNNKINIRIDAEGLKKTVKPLTEIAEKTLQTKEEAAKLTTAQVQLNQALDSLGITSTQTNGKLGDLAREIKNIQTVLANFKAGKLQLDDESVVKYTTRLKALTEEYKKLSQHSKFKFDFEHLSAGAGKLSGNFAKISQIAKQASSIFQGMYERNLKLFKILMTPVKLFGGKLASSANEVGKAFQNMSKKAQDSLKKMTVFWNRAMKTFTFMLVRKAITAILTELDTAKQSLALWSDYVGTKFNESVSNINADCMWIAKSIVAAFEPLINAVAPIIDFLAEKITNFLAKVGEFFAALTGQSYYVKAKKNIVDYAKSLDKTKKSAKGALQSFDELNNITTQQNNDPNSPQNTFKDDWDMKPVSQKMKDFAEEVKKIAADLWYPIGKAWDAMKDYVIGGWKYMTNEIKSLAKDMWADFITVWKSDETVEIFKNIFGIVGDIEYGVGNLVKNFHKAWNDGKTGLHIFENIRDVIGILVEHARNVSRYFKRWSKDIKFEPLLKSVENLTNSLKRVADFIGGEFEDVMKLGVLKFTKWFIQKGLPDINNAFATVFDSFNFDKIREDIKVVIKAVEKLFENFISGATEGFKNLGLKIADWFNSEKFTKFTKAISEILGVFTKDRIATVIEGVGTGFLRIAEALADIVSSDAVVGVFKSIGEWIDQKGVEGIADKVEGLVKAIAGFAALAGISSVISSLTASFSGLFSVLKLLINPAVAKGVLAVGTAIGGYEIGNKAGELLSSKDKDLYEKYKIGGEGNLLTDWINFDETPLENLKDALGGIKEMMADINNNNAVSSIAKAIPLYGSFVALIQTVTRQFDAFMATMSKVSEVAKKVFDEASAKITSFKETAITSIAQFAIDVGLKFNEIGVKISEWYNTQVAPWFTVEKWTELANNIGTSVIAGLNSMIEQWGIGIQNWWDIWVQPWFDLAKWSGLLDVIPQSFKDAFKAAANGAIGFLNKILEGVETMLNGSLTDGLSKLADLASKVGVEVDFDFGQIKLPRIPTFATGGFPAEDGIFAANHNELIGTFDNGKTAVANNTQIIEGIASGVSQANQEQYSLLNTMIDLLGVIADKDLTIGDDAIYNSYRRGATRYAKRYGI